MNVVREFGRSIIVLSIAGLTVLFEMHAANLAQSSFYLTKSTSYSAKSPSSTATSDSAAGSKSVDQPVVAPDYVLPPITNKLVPVLNRIPTNQRVVFLGIDDGVTRSDDALNLLTKSHVPVSLFLNDVNVEHDANYFKELQSSGAIVENHTSNHEDLTTLNYANQKQEICANADRFGLLFDRRPTIFRPPYGSYNQITLRAAADCGMRVLISWSAKANGGSMQYQNGNTGLKPGDIVLMHFRPEFAHDFKAYQDAVKAAGLQTASLEDWLK